MNTYYIAGYPISDELYHHGILGQKWGIRRYQNADGTLTAEGKARYSKSIAEGRKLLDRNKTRASGYKKLGINTALRTGVTAFTSSNTFMNAVAKGTYEASKILLQSGAIGLTTAARIVANTNPIITAAQLGLLGINTALTIRDVTKAVKDSRNINNAYTMGITQKKYRT